MIIVGQSGFFINNMQINNLENKKTLIFITFLAFLTGILSFLKLFILKKEGSQIVPAPTQIPTSTPIPTLIPTLPVVPERKIIEVLPIITENYTVQYLPVPKKFFVLILKNPFEKYKTEVENLFDSFGIDPKSPNIFWGSVKGVAPKTP